MPFAHDDSIVTPSGNFFWLYLLKCLSSMLEKAFKMLLHRVGTGPKQENENLDSQNEVLELAAVPPQAPQAVLQRFT